MKSKDWIDRLRKEREKRFEPKYGPIHPETDPRCFIKETIDELLDALNYSEWGMLKGEILPRGFKKIDRDIRNALHTLNLACERKKVIKDEKD